MHFLNKGEIYGRHLSHLRAAVGVTLEGRDKLVVNGPDDEGKPNIFVAKLGTEWARLPERVKVVGPDGKVIKPSKGKYFYVSLGTFNPSHAVMEAGDEDDVF